MPGVIDMVAHRAIGVSHAVGMDKDIGAHGRERKCAPGKFNRDFPVMAQLDFLVGRASARAGLRVRNQTGAARQEPRPPS